VIISDCPSTRDILINDENAILVPMRDPESLRQAIRRAWDDDAYRQRIAARGREYALSLGGEETLARNVAQAVVDFLRQRREKR
jgi:glycosyltransferase involved in cell wall biosynthesis